MLPELEGGISWGYGGSGDWRTLEPSQTFLECEAYCSTMGRMLDVTMRWARLKLWSISRAGCQVGGVLRWECEDVRRRAGEEWLAHLAMSA